MRARAELIYVFYYQVTKGSESITFHTQQCKRPKLTKAYSELTNMFNNGEIEVYGFETVEI